MKKLLSLILAFALMLSVLPVQAFAENEAQGSYNINIPAECWQDLAESNGLFDGFVMKQAMGDVGLFGTNAREYLTGVEQSVYDKLKAFIVKIANNGGLTETTFAPTDFEGLVYSWPTATDVLVAFESQVNMTDVWTALVHDCPYELYWFDKNRENASVGFTTHDDGTNVSITQFTVVLPVSINWRSTPGQSTTMTTDVSRVNQAVKNAKYIAEKYATADDYTKMEGFKNEICNIVSYKSNEITDGSFYVNNSSWQMINVFDGDHETNTVSYGYAKAFQYLCDISEFDNAQCYTIEGTVDGEEYMWNIVTMEDGKTYLVDVASYDTDMPGQYGQYWFAGYDDGGRWSSFEVNGRRYAYHSNNNLFDVELLILADKDYFYQPEGTLYSGQCGDNAHWLLNENGTLTIQGWGDMWSEYTINNTHSYLPPWHDYVKDIKNIVVKPGITSIGDYRFYLCQYAQTATIPDTVTSIGRMAFYSCMALKELSVPDSVIYLNEGSFGNCSSLEKITLSENITAIPDWLLNSAAVTEIVIPDGVTSIGLNAFYLCNNLKEVTLPASLNTISESAFYAYPENTIETVHYKGTEHQWAEIRIDKNNENLTNAYMHFDYDKDAVFNITAGQCENGQVILDKSTAKYEETVTVTAVPADRYQCTRILVNGAEIQGNTFVVHGDSVVTAQFIPVDAGVIAFGVCGDNLTWTLTGDYQLMISGTGKMTDYDSYSAVPWAEYAPEIKEIIIEDGAQTIGKYAFYGLSGLINVSVPQSVTAIYDYAFTNCAALAEINIPTSVKTIRDYAFKGCSSLKNIVIPEGITSVGMCTFQGCGSLEKVVIPDSVNGISWRAFSGCKSLKNIQFPKHSIHISAYAFEGCKSLETVNTYAENGNATFIDEYAFSGCTGLRTAKLAGVRYIGTGAFKNCTALEQVIINTDGVTRDIIQLSKICRNTFDGCRNLKTIYIPIEIKTIENSAFAGCTSLENVCYQGTKPQWQKIKVEPNNENLHRKETFFEAGQDGRTVPVYRLYHMQTAEHFYTRSANERDSMVAAGWIYEGHAFYSPLATGQAVYRLKNPTSGYHHYPYDEDEIKFMLSDGWIDEGFAWYSAKNFPGAMPIYRLYNINILTGVHHFTASEKEKAILLAEGWRNEGTAWYGFGSSAKPDVPDTPDTPVTPEQSPQPEITPSPDPGVPENPGDTPAYTYTVPAYRFENVVTGEQFFTVHRSEKEVLSATFGWKYTGVDFHLPGDGGQKVYRMMDPKTYYHHYTASQKEIETLKSQGWVYEGFAFYSAKDLPRALPVHRLFNLNARYGTHAYTVDDGLKNKLENQGWRYEGAGWYALAKP